MKLDIDSLYMYEWNGDSISWCKNLDLSEAQNSQYQPTSTVLGRLPEILTQTLKSDVIFQLVSNEIQLDSFMKV
jgi:hypothetical protein